MIVNLLRYIVSSGNNNLEIINSKIFSLIFITNTNTDRKLKIIRIFLYYGNYWIMFMTFKIGFEYFIFNFGLPGLLLIGYHT